MSRFYLDTTWDDVWFEYDGEKSAVYGWPTWLYVDSSPSLFVPAVYYQSIVNPDKYGHRYCWASETTTTRPLEFFEEGELPGSISLVNLEFGETEVLDGALSLRVEFRPLTLTWAASKGAVFEPRVGDFDTGVGRALGSRPYYLHISKAALSGQGEGLPMRSTASLSPTLILGYTSEEGRSYVIVVVHRYDQLSVRKAGEKSFPAACFVIDAQVYSEKGLHIAVGERSELLSWSANHKDMLLAHDFTYFDENGKALED
ncbi:MAG: hypothetical protein KDB07_07105 [Planctomycetes bacterium]|nr:hypothetical protein [Planctomycetota bacterium]